MPHIHQKPGQHDLVVSMYIIRTNLNQPKVMLHYHKKLSVWMQFGGHVELNEDPWQAVSHELREESGYELTQLEVLQPRHRLKKIAEAKLHPLPFNINTHLINPDHKHTALDYAFITDQEPKHNISEGESTLLKLASRDELVALSSREMLSSTKDSYLYILDNLINDWQPISCDEF